MGAITRELNEVVAITRELNEVVAITLARRSSREKRSVIRPIPVQVSASQQHENHQAHGQQDDAQTSG